VRNNIGIGLWEWAMMRMINTTGFFLHHSPDLAPIAWGFFPHVSQDLSEFELKVIGWALFQLRSAVIILVER
jgi:hypothetical protein